MTKQGDPMAANSLSTSADKQRLLDAFLVDNQELEALNARLAGFNLFRVLRIERAEIRHSNVLAWLLTPTETHGLGDTFLRRFLSRLLMENDQVDVSLTPAQVELMGFSDVEVMREWQNIDILARSRNDKWCLLIENKIGSKEKKGALAQYKRIAQQEMPAFQIIPVLLTLEGEDPSEGGREAGYIPLSHAQVLDLAGQLIEQHQSQIPGDASTFLNHYMDTLRRLAMQDAELIDLCRTIYRRHREAIDLIVEYGASSQVVDSCEARLRDLIDCEFVDRRANSVWFVPRQMGEHQPRLALSAWDFLSRPVAVACWFAYRKRSAKLQAIMEVGPVSDTPTRARLLRAVKAAGFSFREKQAFKQGAKYTRIVSKFHKLRTDEDGAPDDDPDYIKQVTESLWKKLWDEGSRITDVLKDFDWGGER